MSTSPAYESTLFDRIGGNAALDAIVTIFYDKILADSKIHHFFTGLDMTVQRQKQKSFLAHAFGGPIEYGGMDIRSVHAHLRITTQQFTAVVGHLQSTLEELRIPADRIDEIMTIIASTRDDVQNTIRVAA